MLEWPLDQVMDESGEVPLGSEKEESREKVTSRIGGASKEDGGGGGAAGPALSRRPLKLRLDARIIGEHESSLWTKNQRLHLNDTKKIFI